MASRNESQPSLVSLAADSLQSENDEDKSIDDEMVPKNGNCYDKVNEANEEPSKNHQPEIGGTLGRPTKRRRNSYQMIHRTDN